MRQGRSLDIDRVRHQLGKLGQYHYTTPAFCGFQPYRIASEAKTEAKIDAGRQSDSLRMVFVGRALMR